MRRKTTILLSVLGVTMMWAPTSFSYDFNPTDIEWQSWPGYCKAKYIWTNIGRRSRFANLVTPEQRNELVIWENAGIRGLHHHCAGSAWLQRAQLGESDNRRVSLLNRAYAETSFSFERSNRQAAQFAYLAIQMAAILNAKGESANALKLLEDVIADQPHNEVIYSATAILQRKLGQLEQSKQTLIRGYQATDGASAEINYNLGLVSLELGDMEDAEKYAKLAYKLGYPLPGLRRKLEKAGRM